MHRPFSFFFVVGASTEEEGGRRSSEPIVDPINFLHRVHSDRKPGTYEVEIKFHGLNFRCSGACAKGWYFFYP